MIKQPFQSAVQSSKLDVVPHKTEKKLDLWNDLEIHIALEIFIVDVLIDSFQRIFKADVH